MQPGAAELIGAILLMAALVPIAFGVAAIVGMLVLYVARAIFNALFPD